MLILSEHDRCRVVGHWSVRIVGLGHVHKFRIHARSRKWHYTWVTRCVVLENTNKHVSQ